MSEIGGGSVFVDLANGLRLEFRDESRPVAGDRWYVGLRVLVPVRLPQEPPPGVSSLAWQRIRRGLGGWMHYQAAVDRHFVRAGERKAVLDELRETFLSNRADYLSRPDFSRRFIDRQAAAIQERMSWGEEYLEELFRPLRAPERVPTL